MLKNTGVKGWSTDIKSLKNENRASDIYRYNRICVRRLQIQAHSNKRYLIVILYRE